MHDRASLAALALLALTATGCPGPDGPPSADVPETVIEKNILGTAYLGQQKWAEAEAAFLQAVEGRPDDPRPRNNLAVALMQQGRLDEARALLDEALADDPDFRWAHFNLGLLDKNAGEFASAVTHFEAVARQDPDDLLTQYNLGIVLSRVGREPEAEAAYRRALELDPTHVSSLYGLGRLLLGKGDRDEGARLVALSQEIRTRSGLDAAVGTQYGEQGPYAMGSDYPGDALRAAEAIDVSFEDELLRIAAEGAAWTALPVGAEIVIATAGAKRIELTSPSRARIDVTDFLPSGSTVLALAAADMDDDDDADIVVLLGRRGALQLGWLEHEAAATPSFGWSPQGLLDVGEAASGADLVAVDRDHDGDLDLFWCAVGCRLATNDGSGALTLEPRDAHGVDGSGFASGPVAVGFSDLDNDRDVDLLALEPGGLHVYTNQRDGSFADIGGDLGIDADGAAQLTVVDLNKDGAMDLVLDDALWINRGSRFERGELPEGVPVVIDHDNDGLLDLATVDGLWRNLGAGEWNKLDLDGGEPLGALDLDSDGDLDLVVRDAGGDLVVRGNDGGNARRWVSVRSSGVGDNVFGVGTKLEVLAGALRQKYELDSPLPLHVGLGSRERVQSLRYLWPSGVLQDEVDLEVDRAHTIEQLDRKGTSCPLLYAMRDGRWHFVTDFLGGAAINYRQGPDRIGTPDTDEAIKIEGGLTPDADGRVRLRVNNQLEEVIWFDQLELIAVDHPAGTEVFANERLMPAPPFPQFELFASETIRPVVAARTADGDALARLAARDRDWVGGFELLPFKGYAEPHTLELDLGRFGRDERVVLLLDGWIDYADSSANVAAHQAGVALSPPALTLADGSGGWIETDHLMGFPAGLPKTVAVELTGLFPSDDHRLRIATNMRIYWDRARVLLGGSETPLDVERLPVERAELRYGGFPREVDRAAGPPYAYDPESVEPYRLWKAHAGAYTAFGEVRERLLAIDDTMVTTRNGDEIELVFEAPAPPAEGMTRSWFLFADGFGKDMDPNSVASDRVGPIPFHGMPGYPYDPGVLPPVVDEGPSRLVLPRPDGLHGAVPQAVVARER